MWFLGYRRSLDPGDQIVPGMQSGCYTWCSFTDKAVKCQSKSHNGTDAGHQVASPVLEPTPPQHQVSRRKMPLCAAKNDANSDNEIRPFG